MIYLVHTEKIYANHRKGRSEIRRFVDQSKDYKLDIEEIPPMFIRDNEIEELLDLIELEEALTDK